MVHQDYFTQEEVGEITQDLMKLTGAFYRNLVPNKDFSKKDAATYALNMVRIMHDRVGTSMAAVRLLYTDAELIPEQLRNVVYDIEGGRLSVEDAQAALDGLRNDMKTYFFSNSIPFGDEDELPRSAVLDVPKLGIRGNEALEATVKGILRQYKSDLSSTQIMENASNNPSGYVDSHALVREVAQVILPSEHNKLTLRVGAKNPNMEQLASTYWLALQKASEELGMGRMFDRQEVIQERMNEETYKVHLEDYLGGLKGLLIL